MPGTKADPRDSLAWKTAGYGFLCLYLLVAFLLRNHGTFVDEGGNLDVASCVLKGLHLYRDLFDHHFPLPVYISAGIIVFTGTSLPLVRLVVLFIDIITLLAAMRVSRLYFPVGFAAAVWALISIYYFGNMLLYDNFAMIGGIALGAVCFAVHARGLAPSRGMFVLLATAGFTAVMSNPYFALVAFIAIASLLFAPQVPKRFVVNLGIVIVIPMAGYLCYLAATGALKAFYFDAVVFNTTIYKKYATVEVLPAIKKQLLFFDIFNPHWRVSFDPLRFVPDRDKQSFDYWIFSGFFYRVAAIAACLLFALRRDYKTAVFLYLFAALLPLRSDEDFHVAPFVLFSLFLVGVLIQEAVYLKGPWKLAMLALCCLPTAIMAVSGARYVARHALQSDFRGLMIEAEPIVDAAQKRSDVRLGYYPAGSYMYYLTGMRPFSKFIYLYPWVAEVGRAELDQELAHASNVVLAMETSGSVWGFANADTLSTEVAYARQHLVRERLGLPTLYVSPSLAVQHGTEAPFKSMGAPFGEAGPRIEGGWTQNGYYKGPNSPGAPPVQGAVFGSYPDSSTGTMRLGPFHLDGQTGMAIPLVTGPDNHGLSIVVRDAASKDVLAKMDPLAVRVAWWAWDPELPLGRELTVEVVAEDKGSGWGQWMALGWPHVLRKRKPGPSFKPGLYRNGEWRLATDVESAPPNANVYHFGGQPGDVPVSGDWNGSGTTKIGIYRPSTGTWLLDSNGNGTLDAGDRTYHFGGQPGDVPVSGDWNGSGTTKIGVYRPATGEWLLDYNGDGAFNLAEDRKYKFGGAPGDMPVTGDWAGSGRSYIGIVRKDYLWLLDSNGDGKLESTDAKFFFGGVAGDIPITGDWNGNGTTKPGVFRTDSMIWLLGNYRFDGISAEAAIQFGSAGGKPVTGAW